VPKPISELRSPSNLLGILFDVDDTVTWEGKLVPEALLCMARAQAAGLRMVPVTGRPGGWVDHLARMWPVDGVVGENGGLWFWMQDGKMHRRFSQSADVRMANMERLERVRTAVLAEVPGTAIASDQDYRHLDLAIDFCEDVPPLDNAAIDAIVSVCDAHGAVSKISSIHVNTWYGQFDKLAGFEALHKARWGGPVDFSRWAYFGDSANDEPMFKAFELSIGVANVADFLPRLEHKPTWITEGSGGHGFVEGMAALGVLSA
jgi:HAD superfamily hydrolase (TIGR01484 family)